MEEEKQRERRFLPTEEEGNSGGGEKAQKTDIHKHHDYFHQEPGRNLEEEMHLPPPKPPTSPPEPAPHLGGLAAPTPHLRGLVGIAPTRTRTRTRPTPTHPPCAPPPPPPEPPPSSEAVYVPPRREPAHPPHACKAVEIDPSPTSSIDMAWIATLRKDINSAIPMDVLDNQSITIFKVPNYIRQVDPGAYNPFVASFGPFHASFGPSDHHQNQDPHVISVTEYHKQQCVRHLLSRHESEESANQSLDKCCLELIKQDDKVRSCYSEEFSWLDAHNLASIMLLDGCLIIYLMLKKKEPTDTGEADVFLNILEEKPPEFPPVVGFLTLDIVVHDLLKLENQIPFFIIQLLFDNLKTPQDGHNLVDLAFNLFKGIHPEESKSFNKSYPREYHHLLHLFYLSRTHLEKPVDANSAADANSVPRTRTSPPKWIPNATELDRAGVKFKRKKPSTGNFLDITFEQRRMKITPLLCLLKLCLMFRSGRMEIPPLHIYGYTGHLFRNLIAFEQCYYNTEMYITIYALFMDCIIDKAEDVRLLHLEGILEHKLSSDHAVAELFNKLGCYISFNWKKNYLTNQIEEVNKFYDSKWHKTLAALRRDYLGNPWAIISVLAAIFLLLLTIEQATFSALSYFHSS